MCSEVNTGREARPPSLAVCRGNEFALCASRGHVVGGIRSPAWLGLQSASDLMLIGYPKGNSSNNGSCEMYRAVIGMVLRNPARTQGPGPPLGCTELGDGPAPSRSLVQGALKEWASTFLPGPSLIICF